MDKVCWNIATGYWGEVADWFPWLISNSIWNSAPRIFWLRSINNTVPEIRKSGSLFSTKYLCKANIVSDHHGFVKSGCKDANPEFCASKSAEIKKDLSFLMGHNSLLGYFICRLEACPSITKKECILSFWHTSSK